MLPTQMLACVVKNIPDELYFFCKNTTQDPFVNCVPNFNPFCIYEAAEGMSQMCLDGRIVDCTLYNSPQAQSYIPILHAALTVSLLGLTASLFIKTISKNKPANANQLYNGMSQPV